MKSKSCVVIAALFVSGALAPMESAARLNAVDPLQQQGYHYPAVINLNTLTTTAKPVVTLSPTSLVFFCKPIAIACPSARRTRYVTLKNSGNAVLRITSIAMPSYVIFSSWNNCGRNLNAGASCTITVYWRNLHQNGGTTLRITDNAAGSPQTVKLLALFF